MKTITAVQRLQLIGLLTLAEQHNRMLEDIKSSMYELLGIAEGSEGSTWIDDAVYSSAQADTLLRRLSIMVAQSSQQTPPGMVEVRPGKYQREDE